MIFNSMLISLKYLQVAKHLNQFLEDKNMVGVQAMSASQTVTISHQKGSKKNGLEKMV